MTARAKSKKLSTTIPQLADQGVDFVAASPDLGLGIQCKQVAQAGATPYSFVFAEHGMADMADTSYCVLIGGEQDGAKPDQSTLAKTGFDIIDGADTEILHIVIVGRLAGQKAS